MATLREYFDIDAKVLTLHVDWTLGDPSWDENLSVIAKLHFNTEANAKYLSFYFPNHAPAGTIETVLRSDLTQKGVVSSDGDGMAFEIGNARLPGEFAKSDQLVFTKRVLIYFDSVLSADVQRYVRGIGDSLGLYVVVRDQQYAAVRSKEDPPLAFISHDSRDKDALVRQLAIELTSMGCPVWYDEFSLSVGDSLRSNIERGLKTAKKCILVLSPNFLANGGWAKAEYDSVFTREILEKENVILPVWHGVSASDVYAYSPRLADKVGLSSSMNIKALAGKLFAAITS